MQLHNVQVVRVLQRSIDVFNSFPVIPYKNDKDGSLKDVTNLLRRVGLRKDICNTAMFDTYDVREGETPEIIASNYMVTQNYTGLSYY